MEDIVYKIDESLYKEAKRYLPESWMSKLFASETDYIIDDVLITSVDDINKLVDDIVAFHSSDTIIRRSRMINASVVIFVTILMLLDMVSIVPFVLILTMSVFMEYMNTWIKRYYLEKNKYANLIGVQLHHAVINLGRNYLLDAYEANAEAYKTEATHTINKYEQLRKEYVEFFEKVAAKDIKLANAHITSIRSTIDLDVPVTVVYSQNIH